MFGLFDGEEFEKRLVLKRNFELFLLTLILFVLGLANPFVNNLLAFQREAIESGQWWRIFTANTVHLGVTHMLLNLTGFILASLLFQAYIRPLYWYGNMACCCLCVGFGLYLFDTDVVNYVGFSGALYGILAFASLASIKRQPFISILVYAYLLHRVYSQHQADFDPASMFEFIGGNVVASSHLFGLLGGSVFGLLTYLAQFQGLKPAQYKE